MLQCTCHCIQVNVWNVRVSRFSDPFRTRACALACGSNTSSYQLNWKTNVFSISFHSFFRARNSQMNAHCWCCWWKTNRCLFQSPSHQSNCRCHSIWKRFFLCAVATVDDSLVLLFGFCGWCGVFSNRERNVEEKRKYNNECLRSIVPFSISVRSIDAPRTRTHSTQNMESETQTQDQYFGILSSFLL